MHLFDTRNKLDGTKTAFDFVLFLSFAFFFFLLLSFAFFVDTHRNSRRISLRFLAWHVLKVNMQQSAHGHDSVEDALTALHVSEERQKERKKE